jgi:hypothetical protein
MIYSLPDEHRWINKSSTEGNQVSKGHLLSVKGGRSHDTEEEKGEHMSADIVEGQS